MTEKIEELDFIEDQPLPELVPESLSDINSREGKVVDDKMPPADPTGLTAIAGIKSIQLDWNSNTETDFSYYEVYRHTSDAQASAVKIAEVRTDHMFDGGLTGETTYYYWIKAVDRMGNVSNFNASAGVSAMTTNPEEVTSFPLLQGPVGNIDGWTDLTGAQGTLTTNQIGLITFALSGTSAAGSVGMDTGTVYIDLTKQIILVVNFKFDKFTFTGNTNTALEWLLMCGMESLDKRNAFGLRGYKAGDGVQTLAFTVANYATDGTATTTAVSFTANVVHRFQAIYNSGVSIKFYIDDVLVATHTDNLPTIGNTDSRWLRLWGGLAGNDGSNMPTLYVSKYILIGKSL